MASISARPLLATLETVRSETNEIKRGRSSSGEEIDRKIGAAISFHRGQKGMYRTHLASHLGLKESGIRRHETGATKLSFGRLLQICEVLEINPVEIVSHVAPHLFTKNGDTSENIIAIVKILCRLDTAALSSILGVVKHFDSGR